ncbi:FtsX-like permease family protein, partial [Rhodovulum sulfidophilum]|uniref:FtsX-like permease family protein n=1 Tax=Rhodovulum sulfidophilum TaxID=35806 RepID=UPI0009601CE1
FLARLGRDPGVSRVETAPMLRGVLTRINGRPAREVAGDHWVVRGDRGVTYADRPPENTVVTDGLWWPSGYDGPPQVSFAREEADEIGLKLGDEITVNILGAILRDLASAYPNITAIRIKDALDRVAEVLSGLAAAIAYGASATLVTGVIVLIGAAAAGQRARVFEAAVLKTVGAVRGQILAYFALRSAMLGAAAGTVAILAGGVAGWAVMRFVMEGEYRFEPVSALAIVLGGALATLLAGLAFAWRPLAARPA